MNEGNNRGFPSVMGVLSQLRAAGPEGMLGSALAREFLQRARGYNATQVEVNGILESLRRRGRATRSTTMEPTPYYHNVPAYRWHLTSAGEAYYASGGQEGHQRTIQAMVSARQRSREERAQQRSALLAEARSRASLLAPGCLHARNELISELRTRGLLLHEIGDLFGITRERARQVTVGKGVKTCPCPQHWRD